MKKKEVANKRKKMIIKKVREKRNPCEIKT